MARIPTYTAEAGLPAATNAPQASAAAYAAPARALGGLGEAIGQTGEVIGRIGVKLAEQQQAKQEQDDNLWASMQAEEFQQKLAEFATNPENQSRSDFGEAFKSFAEGELDRRAQQAGNQKASQKLNLLGTRVIGGMYYSVLKDGEQNRQANIQDQLRTSALNISSVITSGVQFSPDLIQERLSFIESLPYSDSVKSKYKAAYTKDLIIGTMSANPAFAEALLNGSQDFDTEAKFAIQSAIDQKKAIIFEGERYDFEKNLKQIEAVGVLNFQRVPLPDPTPMRAAFKTDTDFRRWWDAAKNDIEVHNQSIDVLEGTSAFNPEARSAEIADRISKIPDGPTKLVVTEKAKLYADKVNLEYKQNTVAALKKYNPAVKEFEDSIARMSYGPQNAFTTSQIDRLRKQRDELVWNLQGYSTDEDSPIFGKHDAREFLNKAEDSRDILDANEARLIADRITNGDWKTRIQELAAFTSRYDNVLHRFAALKDVEAKTENKSFDIQRALVASNLYQSGNAALAQTVLSPEGAKLFSQISDTDKKTLNDKLSLGSMGDSQWKKASLVLRGANNERADMVGGFADAIKSVAANFIINGKQSVEAAYKNAYEAVINKTTAVTSTLSFEMSSSSDIAVARQRLNVDGNLNKDSIRSDEDIARIGRNLEVFRSSIKAEDIETSDFLGNASFADLTQSLYVGNEPNYDLVQKAIRSNGLWISTPDNQGATFYLKGIDGTVVAPVNKRTGRPWSVNYYDMEYAPFKMPEFKTRRATHRGTQ
jgi:hypothetical protein